MLGRENSCLHVRRGRLPHLNSACRTIRTHPRRRPARRPVRCTASHAKSVAIVGGGASGIAVARFAKDEGLQPVIFEKSSCAGGIWSAGIPTYKSLRTNLTTLTMRFSDFPYQRELPLYPTKADFGEYLMDYFRAHFPDAGNDASMLRLQSKVTNVAPVKGSAEGASGTKWEVSWQQADAGQYSEVFDHVVITSGFFSRPRPYQVPGLDTFPGPTLHSSAYRSPEPFANRHVAVIGSSISANEISSELAAANATVTNICPHPFWVLPRYVPANPTDPATPFLPLDLGLFFRVMPRPPVELTDPTLEYFAKQHAGLSTMLGDQATTIHPNLAVPKDDSQYIGFHDDLAAYVRGGRIRVVNGRLTAVNGSRLVVNGDQELPEPVDAIVFATGYEPAMEFLPQEVLESLEYQPHDSYQPLLLHDSTFHPSLPGAAFVGVHPRPFIPLVEAQARWVAGVFGGRLPTPTPEEMAAGVEVERKIRHRQYKGQNAYVDPIGRLNRIATSAGVMLPDEWIQKQEFRTLEQYAGEMGAAEEAGRRLEARLGEFREGRLVAMMVFRALQGRWRVRREVVGGREGEASGVVEGVAEFGMVGANVDRYLYREQGVFAKEGGGEEAVGVQYLWSYDREGDEIKVHMAGADGSDLGLFHTVRVLAPGEEWPEGHGGVEGEGWRAVGEQVAAGGEVRRMSYRFKMQGIRVAEWALRYDVEVNGKRQYSSTTRYSDVEQVHA